VVEVLEGAVDGGAAVAGDHAELEAVPTQAAHGLFGSGVRTRPGRPFKLEALQYGECLVASPARGQRLDELEDVAVRGASDLALDGGEVEAVRSRQCAVEVEQDGLEAERARWAKDGALHGVRIA